MNGIKVFAVFALGTYLLSMLLLYLYLVPAEEFTSPIFNYSDRTEQPKKQRPTQPIENITTVEPVKPLEQPQTSTRLPAQPFSWSQLIAEPGYRFSRGRAGVHWVLGVPTVIRPEKSYLKETLQQLIQQMSERQRQHSLIVVFVGETRQPRIDRIMRQLKSYFNQQLLDGLIDVVAPPAHFYPAFDQLQNNFNDSHERQVWRTKQNLDYMYLMHYARTRGDYYLQLEDDLAVTAGYLSYIGQFTAMQNTFRLSPQRRWIVLSFCELGFIGKLFATDQMKPFLAYVQLFYNDQPIDWLLQSYVKLRVCRWDNVHLPSCWQEYMLYFVNAAQSQFQHVGLESSLPNKQQRLHDHSYRVDAGRQRMEHLRQPFNLVSDHKRALLRQPLQLELGETFIWGYMPQMSSLMRYLQQRQYDSGHFRFRSSGFNEVNVELVDGMPTLELNGSETRRCGFVMSCSYTGVEDKPFRILYFYVKDDEDGNGATWFRRFFWSDGRAPAAPSCLLGALISMHLILN